MKSSSFLLSITFLRLASAAPTVINQCSNLGNIATYIRLEKDITFNSTSVDIGDLNVFGLSGGNNVRFCRIAGTQRYGEQGYNTLQFELWLPEVTKYNGRYLSVGNGGFAGSIDYTSMLANLNNGFAVGGCDSGHKYSENGPNEPGGYVPFLNNRDETLAWIRNSIATFTIPAKDLTTVYYQNAPKKMYYSGCSTGGAQGFALAQYHPEIFDGIYAGSPGNYYSHLMLSFLWNGLNSNRTDTFLPTDALDLITSTVIETCDMLDGVKDGVVSDPMKCAFDIRSLQCNTTQTPILGNKIVCLTSPQVSNALAFYAGPKDSRNGNTVYPGFALGSESEWIAQETNLYLQYGVPILQNLVFKNLSYDYTKFNWGSDVDTVDRNAHPLIDEISPDLSAFESRGGKMIVTQGWADPYNAPGWPIQQYEEMKETLGGKLVEFFNLFMVPGGGHCGGASSYPQFPGTYGVLDRLVVWVEEGKVPRDVIASKPADGSNTTRKLCPYPKKTVYEGGNINDSASYACE